MDIGDQFERYTITGVIGTGGMGRVFRAHDPKLGRDVAIKVLLPGEAGADAKARMLREARAAAALSHPNAVAIYDVGETDATGPYIVMELVVGRSLRELVSDDDVLLSEKLHWLEEIAAALGAAHDRGIVHRDVKPDNVLVRADGAAKVLDFGIARRAASALDPSAPTEAGLPTLTEAGVQVGTPLYMAPEQIRGDAVDGRADQFAWAVVAYELCTGKLPWRTDRGALGATASILTDSPAPMADAPPALEATIRRALSKDPADRFPSMRELLVALRAIDPTLRLHPAPGPAPARAARPGDALPVYDTSQFKEIFGRALQRQATAGSGRYSRQDLVDAAREMGIDPRVLEETLDQADAGGQRERYRVELEERQKRAALRKVARTAITFGVINVVFYFFTHWWNVWMVYGAAIAIAFGLRDVWFPKERASGSREEDLRERARVRIGSRDEAKIEEGVRILLSTTAKRAANEHAAEEEAAAEAPEAAKAPLRAPSSEPDGAPP